MKATNKATVLGGLVFALLGSTAVVAAQLGGMGQLSGTVVAPKRFTAATVTAFDAEKQIKYMVFTAKGGYRATNMYPGTYTVTVAKPGFEAASQTVTIRPGAAAKLDFKLRPAPVEPDYVGGQVYPNARILPYDTIYPAGRGRDIIERTCQGCHTVQLFPYNVKRTYPTGRTLMDKGGWAITVDRMHKGPAFGDRGIGFFNPALFKPGDREILIDYLATNFGAKSEPRVVKKELPDPPLDEAALGKAQFVEYIFPNVAGQRDRFTQQIDFCKGDVYVTDRGLPGLVKLDPRTGAHVAYVGHGGGHGISLDEECTIWYSGDVVRRFDPRNGKHDAYVIENGRNFGSNTTMFDSNGDLWLSLLAAGKIAKWDRKTDVISYWDLPQPGRTWGLSRPYGLVLDNKERVWFAEYHKSSLGMFDPKTQTYRSYPITDLSPTNMRRLGADSKDNMWVATWGRPNLVKGGSIYRLDPVTGAVKEYPVRIPYGNPYDTQADDNDIIWASADNYLIRLDPRTGRMAYYPTPTRTDIPKMTIARNGAIWFTSRGAGQSGGYGGSAAVLYPDKDAITEFAAYFSAKSPANALARHKGAPLPPVQGVIKQSPGGAQNSASPGRATAPKILGPVKPDEASAYAE